MDAAGDEPVRLTFRDREYRVPAGLTVREAIVAVGLAPEIVLAVRDGELLSDSAILRPGERLRLIPVVTGG